MALHSDQSPEALKGTLSTQTGKCVWCKGTYGWWQGVVDNTDKGEPKWVCLVCAALSPGRTGVPPPDGFHFLRVDEDVLRHWEIHEDLHYGVRLTRTCAAAMPLLLAWSLETGLANVSELKRGLLVYGDKKPSKTVPIIFKRPCWLNSQGVFLPAAYADSDEDRVLHGIFREALRDPEWTRTAFIGGNPGDFFVGVDRWAELIPDSHPGRAEGLEVAIVLPWMCIVRSGTVKGESAEIAGCVFHAVQVEAVEAAVMALIRSQFVGYSTDPDLLPDIWSCVGLTRSNEGAGKVYL
jgi:hypothetical protein